MFFFVFPSGLCLFPDVLCCLANTSPLCPSWRDWCHPVRLHFGEAPCKKCTGWLLRQCLSSWYLLITCFHFCRPVVLISSCVAQFCFPKVAFSKFFFPHPLKIEITYRALPAATESPKSMQGSCWSVPAFEGDLHVRPSSSGRGTVGDTVASLARAPVCLYFPSARNVGSRNAGQREQRTREDKPRCGHSARRV